MFSDNKVVRFDDFLSPISEENPGGGAYEDEQIFFVLQNTITRIEEEIKSEHGVSDDLKKSIDGHIKTIELAFKKSSKGLQLVGYYMQLMFFKYQFNGLRDGIELLKRLVEQFWDHLQPSEFPERFEDLKKVTPVFFADDMPLYVLNRIKLDDDGEFNVMDLIRSESVANLDLDTKYFKRIHVDNENTEFFTRAVNDFDEILANVEAIDEIFETRLAEDRDAYANSLEQEEGEDEDDFNNRKNNFSQNKPVYLAYKGVFEDDFTAKIKKIRHLVIEKVRNFQHDFLSEDEGEPEEEQAEATGGGTGGTGISGTIDSRATALQCLERVAQYFKANEPHSPIPYALMEIKEWGALEFPQLIHRLGHRMMDDEDAMKKISQRLNFNWPELPPDDY